MMSTTEVPDRQVLDHAEQFLDTAKLLLRHIPSVVAPSALRCNAAFAIELFIKALNSRWEEHDLTDEMGIEGWAITSKPNQKGHGLVALFGELPNESKKYLHEEFKRCSLYKDDTTLSCLLKRYDDAFERERYVFERRSGQTSHPIREIVDLAQFFRDVVRAMPTVRT